MLFTSYSFAQGPWTLEKKKVYTQLNYSTISNYNAIFGSPDYETERTITDNTLQLYAEYGLFSNTTLIINLPVKFIKTGELTNSLNTTPFTISDSETALGNIVVGVKQQLLKDKWVLAAQLNIEANTSSFDSNSGIRTGYDAWTFTPTINVGRSFNGYYAQAFTGLDLRTNNYSSNFKIGGEFGVKVLKYIWAVAYIDFVQSFENGDIVLPLSNQLTALYVNDQSYGGYGLKGIGEITKAFGVTASFGGAFSGNNVAKKVAYNFGLYHKF